ncbi:MAG TPA: NAD(P)-dependent oxidoreductase [Geminicoccaceae bacterium]
MADLAFVGLGNMGRGMAARLLAAGHEVAVYNRTTAKAAALGERGARVAASPCEAVEGADAVFVMVGDDRASRSVWLGDDGILAGTLRERAFAIECSTLSHDWVEALATQAAARGLRYLDCPVTGLPDAAAAGDLTLLVGAQPADLAAAHRLLDPLCSDLIHFGPVGTGTAYKLMINLMGAVQIAAAAEGMAIAERAGLDLDLVARAIASGQAASPQVVRNARRMADDHHDRDISFTGRLRLKDAEYGVRLAKKLGLGAPLGRVACEAFGRLLEHGLADLNESKVIEIARAGGEPDPAPAQGSTT